VLALAANGLLWLNVPLIAQTLAALTLTLALPGWLLARLWVGNDSPAPDWLAMTVYAGAVGFGLQTLVMLWLSYWPGPVTFVTTLLAFNLLCFALWLGCLHRDLTGMTAAHTVEAPGPRRNPLWTNVAIIVILLVGGLLRHTDLGYAEFQGDEGRAVLRAAAVLQGYEEVLFLHRKGPQEILTPAATYALTGHLTEATARLPFALASLLGVVAVYCLGRRMFGPVAGCCAALLLAVDGYFIGFARIVQYQSIVLLTTTAAVLLLYQTPQRPASRMRDLTLAAFLVASGALAHYEAILALIPAVYLLWSGWKDTPARRQWIALAAALIAGAVTLACFFVPYIFAPSFANTFAYLTGERIGDNAPYNHLADFFLRTSVYSSSYAVLLQCALATIALCLVYRRGLRQPWSWLAIILVVVGLVWTFVHPGWLVAGERDLTVLFFAAILAGAWFLPGPEGAPAKAERTLWLWFGLLMLLALFAVAKPRTHVYIFFIPWALLAGMVVQRFWESLHTAWGSRAANLLVAGLLASCLLVFGMYGYWFFVYNQVEVFRTWEQNRPQGYWAPYTLPDDQSLFGFPIQSGWKAVGVLYARGQLDGAYTTNDVDAWVTDWYTRGANRCLREHRFQFVADHLARKDQQRRQQLLAELPQGYRQRFAILVYHQPRLQVWEKGNEDLQLNELPIDELAAEFDAHLSGPDFPLTAPAIEPPIQHPQKVLFGEHIRLEGYALDRTSVAAGENMQFTLYWRATGPVETRYRVETHLRGPDGAIAGSASGEPGCDAQRTDDWTIGELIVDPHRLIVAPKTSPGAYKIYTSLVDRETGETLAPVHGAEVVLGVVEITAPTVLTSTDAPGQD
jgi:4-amino-4-deoxy-L-arabinose transferase-like glycosyltransferase